MKRADHRSRVWTLLAAALVCTSCASNPKSVETQPLPPLITVAEASDFRATSTYDQTMEFLEELDRRSDRMHLTTFGRSAAGRPLPLLIASRARAFDPETAERSEKPVVVVLSGIHPGEIDGKVASLMILRELTEGKHHSLLDHVTLLFIPIYNVDGHEHVSPFNRANQDGPRDGMGFRATNTGHDLNRDHLKLETPEAQAFIQLFNDWRPHLIIDNHVTNGVGHDWVLTYSYVEAPQLSPHLSGWLDLMMKGVLKDMKSDNVSVGPYVSLRHRLDPTAGFSSWVGEPRYSTGYFPLRNRPTILVENHAHRTFEERVRANYAFLLSVFREVGKTHTYLLEAAQKADEEVVEMGRPGAAPSKVAVVYELSEESDRIELPLYEHTMRTSKVTGGEYLEYEHGVLDPAEVNWHHLSKVALAVPRPRGYLVMPGWPQINQRLLDHGLEFACLSSPITLDVETIRVSEPQFSPNSYQGLVRVQAQVSRQIETRDVPEGAFWIPADQPDFHVAVQMFEPEAPDSLLQWGLLSSVFERKEFISVSKLEKLSEDLLQDSVLRAEWEKALEDETFAQDGFARFIWWYKKTPYWDERVGLLPIYRVMSPVPPLDLHSVD